MPSFSRVDLGLDAGGTRQESEPRRLSLAATLLALSLAALWPIALGVLAGAAGAVWWSDWSWLKYGLVAGVGFGVLMSGAVLASSAIVNTALARPPVAVAQPSSFTVGFRRLDEFEQDTRLIPVLRQSHTIDGVSSRDLAWYLTALSMGTSHTQRGFLGCKAPSGARVDVPMWTALSRVARKAGIVAGVGPRRKGRVVSRDLTTLLTTVGLDPYDMSLLDFRGASEPWQDMRRRAEPGD